MRTSGSQTWLRAQGPRRSGMACHFLLRQSTPSEARCVSGRLTVSRCASVLNYIMLMFVAVQMNAYVCIVGLTGTGKSPIYNKILKANMAIEAAYGVRMVVQVCTPCYICLCCVLIATLCAGCNVREDHRSDGPSARDKGRRFGPRYVLRACD